MADRILHMQRDEKLGILGFSLKERAHHTWEAEIGKFRIVLDCLQYICHRAQKYCRKAYYRDSLEFSDGGMEELK